MAKIAGEMKRSLSANNPKITLDLADVYGVETLPDDNLLRQAIGQAIVDKIVENAKSGDFLAKSSGANKYSESYQSSDEFKVYGKSAGDVNLTASGDMLRAIDFEISGDGKMSIYFNDELEAAKAHGHITGNVGKKRDFFGLDQKDLVLVTSEFREVVRQEVENQGRRIEIETQQEQDLNFVLRLISGQS